MLRDLLIFIILGLGPGALFAGLGLGVALQYRGSGTIDLSLGATAMASAYIFFGLRVQGELFLPIPFVPLIDVGDPWPLAPSMAATVVIGGAMGAAVGAALARLRTASVVAKLIASLSVLLSLVAMVILRFGTEGVAASPVLPSAPVTFLGATVPEDRLLLLGIVTALVVGLSLVYRYTRYGLAERAAAENETAALLVGLAPSRIVVINSMAAYAVVAILGVLAAQTTTLDATVLTLAIVPALAAALFGQFTSLWITGLAALGVGVVQSLVVYLASRDWFPKTYGTVTPGVFELVLFVLVVVALFWRGRGIPERGVLTEGRLPASPPPRRVARPTIVLTTLGVLGLLFLPADFRQAEVMTLVGIVLCLSFTIITGYAGQVSLIQMAIAGIGAFGAYDLATKANVEFPWNLVLVIPIAATTGVIVGISALRIRGAHLAIVTLAGATAVSAFGLSNPIWGDTGASIGLPPPNLFGLNLAADAPFPGWDNKLPSPAYGFFALGVAIIICILVALLRKSILGKKMLAVRSNERAAAAVGVNVRNTKVAAAAMSSVVAAIGGVLFAYSLSTVGADMFGLLPGLALLAAAYIGGITTVRGAIIGGMLVAGSLPNHAFYKWTSIPPQYNFLLSGLLLMWTLLFMPQGIALGFRQHLALWLAPFRLLAHARPTAWTGRRILDAEREAKQ